MSARQLDIDKTRDRLLSLGCTYAAEGLGRLLAEAVSRDIPAHTFIDQLLDSEINGREARRRAVSLKIVARQQGWPVSDTTGWPVWLTAGWA